MKSSERSNGLDTMPKGTIVVRTYRQRTLPTWSQLARHVSNVFRRLRRIQCFVQTGVILDMYVMAHDEVRNDVETKWVVAV